MTMKRTAKLIGTKEPGKENRGRWKLYKMTPPAVYERYDDDGDKVTKHSDYVIASQAEVFGVSETYLFPANSDFTVASWGELPGSQKGNVSHEDVIRAHGYEIEE
jgi:hypothetical protein